VNSFKLVDNTFHGLWGNSQGKFVFRGYISLWIHCYYTYSLNLFMVSNIRWIFYFMVWYCPQHPWLLVCCK